MLGHTFAEQPPGESRAAALLFSDLPQFQKGSADQLGVELLQGTPVSESSVSSLPLAAAEPSARQEAKP